jgi:glutathione S-transferase
MFTRPARRVERWRLLRLYDYLESGNGYKIRLLLARLGLAYERIEQYSHEPYIAVLRHWAACDELDAHRSELAERRQRGEAALDVMEGHLAGRDFFVGDRYSIADIALYAYTHVAEEGGYDLSARRVLRSWLDRVADEPGHISIDCDPARG